MCKECGCGEGGRVQINGCDAATHAHSHEHGGHHHAGNLHIPLLDANDRQAERNRGYFEAKNIGVVNIFSSPGSGKTTLIGETVRRLGDRHRIAVIVGDLATDNDAKRLQESGIPVIQITTGTMCHLDAAMIAEAVKQLDTDHLDLLIIENVGNLVCPADYDLGEALRIVLLSTTEGEDKPLKYPPMFHAADIAVITKTDIAEAADFDREQALASLGKIAHHAHVCEVSARTGQGMDAWCDELIHILSHKTAAFAHAHPHH